MLTRGMTALLDLQLPSDRDVPAAIGLVGDRAAGQCGNRIERCSPSRPRLCSRTRPRHGGPPDTAVVVEVGDRDILGADDLGTVITHDPDAGHVPAPAWCRTPRSVPVAVRHRTGALRRPGRQQAAAHLFRRGPLVTLPVTGIRGCRSRRCRSAEPALLRRCVPGRWTPAAGGAPGCGSGCGGRPSP